MANTQKISNHELELIISYFNRDHYEQQSDTIVPADLKHLMVQFSKKIFPSTILSMHQDLDLFALLINKLNEQISHKNINLLYRASEHDFTSASFHEICEGIGPFSLKFMQ